MGLERTEGERPRSRACAQECGAACRSPSLAVASISDEALAATVLEPSCGTRTLTRECKVTFVRPAMTVRMGVAIARRGSRRRAMAQCPFATARRVAESLGAGCATLQEEGGSKLGEPKATKKKPTKYE